LKSYPATHKPIYLHRGLIKFNIAYNGSYVGVVLLLRVARRFIFKPKIKIWIILEGIAIEDVGIFYDHLVYLTAIWYILWTFGSIDGHLDIFSRFGM
jgi:hypothetical protein